jgi:hypothetical protein
MTPDDLFVDHPLALAVSTRVVELAQASGPIDVRTSKSQVAFRRRRGFAYVWRPGQYLSGRRAEAVLSIALGRRDGSPRWKEVAHPTANDWIHHLDENDVAELDDEVAAWLAEAADRAG